MLPIRVYRMFAMFLSAIGIVSPRVISPDYSEQQFGESSSKQRLLRNRLSSSSSLLSTSSSPSSTSKLLTMYRWRESSYSDAWDRLSNMPPIRHLRSRQQQQHLPLRHHVPSLSNGGIETGNNSTVDSNGTTTVDTSMNRFSSGDPANMLNMAQASEDFRTLDVTNGPRSRDLSVDEVPLEKSRSDISGVVDEEQNEDYGDSTPRSVPVDKVPVKDLDMDIVTKFLRIVESQSLLGDNCTAGTEMNLGDGVVDRYAQERFRLEAEVAVNRANFLTRLWKYDWTTLANSEYLLYTSVRSMVEFDDDIFAAGNCYDKYAYKDYWLFCAFGYRLPEGPILVKDLAVEYKYLSNTSEWFYRARKSAERVIQNFTSFKFGKS